MIRRFAGPLLAALLVLAPTVALAQGGVSSLPSRLPFGDVLRGESPQRSVTLINNTGQDRVLKIGVTGDAAAWITVARPDGTALPDGYVIAGGEELDLVVTIDVPSDAPNGPASAAIEALFEVPRTEGVVNVDLAIGVPITMDVTGDQRLEGTFQEFVAFDTEIGLPIRMALTIANSGNVSVAPFVDITILEAESGDGDVVAGEEVDSYIELGDPIRPGERRALQFTWPTDAALPGLYIVRAAVDFGGLDLGSREAIVEVAQRGTLTRSGVIRSMEIVGGTVLGGVTRVEVVFANTGQIEARAIFQGEVSRDGALIEVVQSLQRLVLPGQNDVIEVFVQTPVPGEYTLTGTVNFEGSETESQTLTFVVEDPASLDEGDGVPIPLVIGAGIGGIVLLGGVVWWLRWRRPATGSQGRTAHDAPSRGGSDTPGPDDPTS